MAVTIYAHLSSSIVSKLVSGFSSQISASVVALQFHSHLTLGLSFKLKFESDGIFETN